MFLLSNLMKKSIHFLKSIILFMLFSFMMKVQAQCPAVVSATIASQTIATCPSNASVTIGTNALGSAIYQVITAPSGVSLAPQSSNVFTSLPPGAYTFKVTCGASSANVSTTITSSYTQLTATTTSINTCANNPAGRSITVTAAGGTTPYSYALIKTMNANYNDALSVYGASNILNPLDTGVYQVRIKDNCGNFITKSVVMQPLVPAITLLPIYLDNDQPCGSGNVSLYYDLFDNSGSRVYSDNFINGYTLDIYKKGVGCTRGIFIKTVNKAQYSDYKVIIPLNQDLYIRVTNSCGDTTFVCYDFPLNALVYKIHWQTVSTGCVTVSNPNGFINLGRDWVDNGKGPETYSVVKLDGSVVRTPTVDSTVFHNLSYDTYVVVGVDACGAVSKDTLYPAPLGDSPSIDEWQQTLDCANQTGTITVDFSINGYLNDLANAVITIVSGPSNVGVVASYNGNIRDLRWANMLPGNYVASVVTGCGTTLINFEVIVYIPTLEQTLTLNAIQVCNEANTIQSDFTYNGYGNVYYDLFNASNVNVGYNSTGIFTAVPAGTYTVRASIETWGNCPNMYSISKTIQILSGGAPPVVNKKIVSICEDGSGNPTANGKAIIRSAGFAPFKVEVKRVAEPDANYAVKYAASVNDFTVDNLTAYENYRIRITDQCGNTALTDVAVGILEQLSPIDNGTACYNNSYTLSAPDMIDATYTWRKGSTIVATTREIVFPNYTASNNGLYTCTISIGGGCVTRIVSNNLLGSTCSVLPIKIENFTAANINCKTQLSWKVNDAASISSISLQRSANAISFDEVKNITDATIQNFVDASPLPANNFYRLLITENDGNKVYSNIVTQKNNCITEKNSLSVTPNPVYANSNVKINIGSTIAGKTEVKIYNSMGQMIKNKMLNAKVGLETVSYTSAELSKGVNIVVVVFANGETLNQKIIVQ
jgi:Immunoglobulin domain